MPYSPEIDICYEKIVEANSFDDLPSTVQKDLLDWYNVAHESVFKEDEALLLNLYTEGRFSAWTCPHCEQERVFKAEIDTEEEWGIFQATLNQDFASYPGKPEKYQPEYIEAMCDHCRCWK